MWPSKNAAPGVSQCVHQLAELLAGEGTHLNGTPATYEQVHRALLTGLLGNVGVKSPEDDQYQGARAINLHLPAY